MSPAGLRRSPDERGFTLAEVAVTLVIVGLTLMLVLQGLSSSKAIAAQANNRKLAIELALMTLGRVETGGFWEELDGLPGTFNGTYAEEGYEAFAWELIVGDEEFRDYEDEARESAYFDNFAHRRYVEEEYGDEDDDLEAYSDVGTTGGPYERVAVRVTYPKLTDQPDEVLLERYLPLTQVFGHDDDAVSAELEAGEDGGAQGGGR